MYNAEGNVWIGTKRDNGGIFHWSDGFEVKNGTFIWDTGFPGNNLKKDCAVLSPVGFKFEEKNSLENCVNFMHDPEVDVLANPDYGNGHAVGCKTKNLFLCEKIQSSWNLNKLQRAVIRLRERTSNMNQHVKKTKPIFNRNHVD